MLYHGFSFKWHNRSELSPNKVNATNFICNAYALLNDCVVKRTIFIKNCKNLVGYE